MMTVPDNCLRDWRLFGTVGVSRYNKIVDRKANFIVVG